MICPSCQQENSEGARFCNECASPLAESCPSCGGENSPGAKFCNQCAAPLTAAPSSQVERDPRTYTPKHLADKILQSKSALEATGNVANAGQVTMYAKHLEKVPVLGGPGLAILFMLLTAGGLIFSHQRRRSMAR